MFSDAQPHDRLTDAPGDPEGDVQDVGVTPGGTPGGTSGRYGPDSGRAVEVSDLVVPGSNDHVEVIHHQSDRFYELLDGGMSVAMLVYEQSARQTAVTHAMVREDRRGQGLGTTLIATALPDLAASVGKIANYCDSVARFLDKYPDYRKFVSSGR